MPFRWPGDVTRSQLTSSASTRAPGCASTTSLPTKPSSLLMVRSCTLLRPIERAIIIPLCLTFTSHLARRHPPHDPPEPPRSDVDWGWSGKVLCAGQAYSSGGIHHASRHGSGRGIAAHAVGALGCLILSRQASVDSPHALVPSI